MNEIKTYDMGGGLELIEGSDLAALALQINEAAQEAERHARGATENALAVGAMLIEAKLLVKHGEWDNWILQNCEIAPRTVQAYMRLAKTLPQLGEQEAQRVTDLPVREAIRAIATSPVAPKIFKSKNVYLFRKEDYERAAGALTKGSNALKEAAKKINYLHGIKGPEITALKRKLTDALEAIERMEADSAAQAGEVAQ